MQSDRWVPTQDAVLKHLHQYYANALGETEMHLPKELCSMLRRNHEAYTSGCQDLKHIASLS